MRCCFEPRQFAVLFQAPADAMLFQTRWAEVARPGVQGRSDMDLVNSKTATEHPADVTNRARPRQVGGPGPGTEVTTVPPPGQPGHGVMASLRRQPVQIVDGRAQGGYTDVFEVICPDCGDDPSLDYSEVSTRLRRLRGRRTLQAGLAAYERHLG